MVKHNGNSTNWIHKTWHCVQADKKKISLDLLFINRLLLLNVLNEYIAIFKLEHYIASKNPFHEYLKVIGSDEHALDMSLASSSSSLSSSYRLLDSLVLECWHRVREVPGSIPSQGPRHTKDVIKMVPVVPLFCTEH